MPRGTVKSGIIALLTEISRLRAENTRLAALADELAGALETMLPDTFTGPYDRAREIAHWEYEREEGNGNAQTVLDAFAALSNHAKMKGEG